MNAMTIRLEAPGQADVLALIAELDAYQHSLYPPESVYALDLAGVEQGNVLLAVVRDQTASAVACGAVVLGSAYGEVKRMYVRPAYRGLGLARRILATLESEAEKSGCRLLKLETGPHHHEALGLYAQCGYERRGPFGSYPDDPLSVFMQKHISA
jgi:putative acetyltransferase